MAFVVTQRISTTCWLAMVHAGRRITDWLRAESTLTPQERANLYVSRMPLAVITASMGGHPVTNESSRH